MYSVVLLMALSGGADTPALGFGRGCNGCACGGWMCNGGGKGCNGGGLLSGLFGGKRGKGCNGCAGLCHGCFDACHGGAGACHGGFGHGCAGACHGGFGHGCAGLCHGGGGGCHGGFGHGCAGLCHGGDGGCHGCAGLCHGCGGGCHGSMDVQGGHAPIDIHGGHGIPSHSAPIVPSYPIAPAAPAAPATPIPVEPRERTSVETPAPATIVVNLPANARLTVDGNPTNSTSERRVFVSPALERGMEYYYTLQAELVRDGQTQTRTERVAVRAGQEIQVNLQFQGQSVAAN